MEPPKVVLDTSVVLRPVIQPNSSHRWLLEFWQLGRIKPLVSYTTKENCWSDCETTRPISAMTK